jgi:ribonuclease HI
MNRIEIFTDGACRGNPGKGGWGVMIRSNGLEESLYGGNISTTNNIMELTAAIKALEYIPENSNVVLTTDSKYVMQGITEWIKNWKIRDWKTASKKPVLNKELWKRLDSLTNLHSIEWKWVKGHSGHRENEIADQLANKGIDEI